MTPLEGLTLPIECGSEYDSAAKWCAQRGLKGDIGDRLPDLLSVTVANCINSDPESFQDRVCDMAYALAMEAHQTRCSICGDAIEADDETYEDRGAIAHRQCCEAAAEIDYSEAGIW